MSGPGVTKLSISAPESSGFFWIIKHTRFFAPLQQMHQFQELVHLMAPLLPHFDLCDQHRQEARAYAM